MVSSGPIYRTQVWTDVCTQAGTSVGLFLEDRPEEFSVWLPSVVSTRMHRKLNEIYVCPSTTYSYMHGSKFDNLARELNLSYLGEKGIPKHTF